MHERCKYAKTTDLQYLSKLAFYSQCEAVMREHVENIKQNCSPKLVADIKYLELIAR